MKFATLGGVVLFCTAGVAFAQQTIPAQGEVSGLPVLRITREVGSAQELKLETGQNRLLLLSEPIGRVSVAEPAVADLRVVTPTQLLLTAKGAGATDLTLWNKLDTPLVIALTVTRNLEAMRKQINELFPGEKISVTSSGELIVLSGEVSDVRLPERIGEIAKLHSDKLVNLVKVSGNQQVQIEVKFAEVSRSSIKQMGVNIFHMDSAGRWLGGVTSSRTGAGNFIWPPPGPPIMPGTSASVGMPPVVNYPAFPDAFSLFVSEFSSVPLSIMLNLLESTGLARTLAQPTLVTLSGQQARFLAGGELPIPMAGSLGQISVDWKKFGVQLRFTPTVIDKQTIHLALNAEVSDLDPKAAVSVGGYTIPGLSSRQSEATVRLGDGQSFAIAGLLSDELRTAVDKVPVLGSIPVLGALFRSSEYQKEQTELLVVVTARMARPVAAHALPPLPTDHAPGDVSDVAFYLGTGSVEPEGEAQGKRGPSGDSGFAR